MVFIPPINTDDFKIVDKYTFYKTWKIQNTKNLKLFYDEK